MLGIQANNNLNFNGCFKVNYKRAVKGTREFIEQPKFIGLRKYIKNNVNPENSDEVVYVVRDFFDYGLAKVFQRNEIPTTYYPEINTTSKFDTLEQIRTAIASTGEIIKGAGRAVKFIEKNGRIRKNAPKQKIDLRANLLARLNLFFTPTKPVCKKGIYVCKNITGEKGEVIMSQPDKTGNIFIRVIEHEPNAKAKYYKFNKKTNELIQYQGSNGIVQFNKDFKAAQEFYKSKNR